MPTSQGADAPGPARATGLLALPKDLREEIINRTPLSDAARLSCVSTDFRQPEGALKSALLAFDRLPAGEFARERCTLMKPFAEMLDRAATPEKLHAAAVGLFVAVTGSAFYGPAGTSLSSPVRAEVLTLIADRIDRMPSAEHVDALNSFTGEALLTIDSADMVAPLQALARQLMLYPEAGRHNMVGLLARQDKKAVLDRLEPEHRRTYLAHQKQVHDLGKSKGDSLKPSQLAQVLVTLAGEVKSMADGPTTWSYLLQRALMLPAEHRRPVLDALGGQCDTFPPSARPLVQQKLATEKARCPP